MRHRLISMVLAMALVIPTWALAGGGSSDTCDTKYPVVLAHGMFVTDDMFGFVNYWWGIEDALDDEGCDVYATAVNAFDGTEDKAIQWRQQFLEILALTGKAKANVIGHSHGGIYTRYAISNLGVADKVASHTSYCSPQRGSSAADVIMGLIPDATESFLGGLVDVAAVFVFGDSDPDTIDNGYEVTRPYMQDVFNPNNPDMSGIYYQSYVCKIKTITLDLVLEPTFLIVKYYEGNNDGLVSETSGQWGTFRGVESGAWWCGGVSHIKSVGHFFGVTPGFNAGDYFVDMVSDLKDKGY